MWSSRSSAPSVSIPSPGAGRRLFDRVRHIDRRADGASAGYGPAVDGSQPEEGRGSRSRTARRGDTAPASADSARSVIGRSTVRIRLGGIVAAVAALTLAGCGGGGGSGAGPAAAPTVAAPVAQIQITPANGAQAVVVGDAVNVHSNAPLASVTVARSASTSQKTPAGTLAGTFSADRRSWTSTGGLFADSSYQVSAVTQATSGITGVARANSTFATGVPSSSFKVSWEPVDGQTVGVGAPITLTFSAAARDRAAVQSRLLVQTDPPTLGAWNWTSDRTAVWRPAKYWQPGTRVHVEANLAGLDNGGGRMGVKDRAMDFRIGDAHVSYVDANTHVMKVYDNGALVRTMKVSLGRPQWPTMSGPHNVLGLSPEVTMDSATVGIPKGDPDYYYEQVQWAVQFTSGGSYVHSAPWSVASQGRANVSHGCVNASPTDAQWFYNYSRLGDMINISNTGRAPDTSQLGNAWSVPWATWRAGSALPVSDTVSSGSTASPSSSAPSGSAANPAAAGASAGPGGSIPVAAATPRA